MDLSQAEARTGVRALRREIGFEQAIAGRIINPCTVVGHRKHNVFTRFTSFGYVLFRNFAPGKRNNNHPAPAARVPSVDAQIHQRLLYRMAVGNYWEMFFGELQGYRY